MAGKDFAAALRQHKVLGLELLDLRDAIVGKWAADLDAALATEARDMIAAEGLQTFCLSTDLLFGNIEDEAAFKAKYEIEIEKILIAATILQPKVLRLNAGRMPSRRKDGNTIELLRDRHPWLIGLYRDAIDRIGEIGVFPLIENEAFDCFLSLPEEFIDFFALIDRKDAVGLTWDVQNQWASGVFPTMAVYEALKPLIRYYHVKGGQKADDSDRLAWNAALEEADWDVVGITGRVVADGVSPVICLNPPQHGQPKPGCDYDDVTRRDLEFLRRSVPGLM
jgi:hypothetical protein